MAGDERGTEGGILKTRWFLAASALVGLLALAQWLIGLPPVVDLGRKLLSVIWLATLLLLGAQALMRARRQFLWSVRRKLILSYVFLGFVPLVLVLAFVLTGGTLLYTTVAQYMFQEGFSDLSDDVRQIAEASAAEIGRNVSLAGSVLEQRRDAFAAQYPKLGLEIIGRSIQGPEARALPSWLAVAPGFTGVLVERDSANPGISRLTLRAVAPMGDGGQAVAATLPVDDVLISRLDGRTGARIVEVDPRGCLTSDQANADVSTDIGDLFAETVTYIDCTTWSDGRTGTVSIKLRAPVGALSAHMASVHSTRLARDVGSSWWHAFVELLVLLAVLFVIVQGAAVVMGGLLARSITSAIDELFVGTKHVQQADFGHRITIASRDQLGELAGSFNQMSASIDNLLHVQREKQRLDDELRIARDIQRSLLPVRVPEIAGLDIADLCEPAREVGGDYYDFFRVGPKQLGILIADVSGKGTSAALYMAELKGLMLALSHAERSPRRLLIDVNRRLAEHLDNRSFITMTYAIFDLETSRVTLARAGHTPAIHVRRDGHEMLAPRGMVLGLRLPGAGERFESLLAEETAVLARGDVFVLYTDGVTDAMNDSGDLFGDTNLVRVLEESRGLRAVDIRDGITRAVRDFVGSAGPHDDMTVVVVKIGDEPSAVL